MSTTHSAAATTITQSPLDDHSFVPHNAVLRAMLTDLYQITMAYAYWVSARHDDHSVFELFFRRCPFAGEVALFAGLEEAVRRAARCSLLLLHRADI